MNKSTCCNAEVRKGNQSDYFYKAPMPTIPDYFCKRCNKHQELKETKSKVTKYYQVKFTTRDFPTMTVVEAQNPQEALKLSQDKDRIITDIKLIEIIQEDTNQE